MPNTTNLGLTYPALSAAPNVPQDLQTLAGQLDTKVGGIIICTSVTRPTAREGATIYETDTDKYMSYTGSGWVTLGQNITSTYTPVLTAASGNPALGTGSTASGRYTLFNGNWCTYRGAIQFGSSGATSGTGQYFISLPFNSSANISVGVANIGGAYLRDNSGPAIAQALVYAAASANAFSLVANNTTVSSTVPWTWANSDAISWTLTYEIA